MIPNPESQEWREGFIAYLDGDKHYENPYGAHGQLSLDWHDGFATAQVKDRRSDDTVSTDNP